ELALNNYLFHMNEVNQNLDSIVSIFNNGENNISESVDELKNMLQTKADLMYALVELKNLPGYQSIADKTMKNIAITMQDTATAIEIPEKENVDPGLKSSSSSEEINTYESEKKKLKNLFSNKDKNRTPIPPAIILQQDTIEQNTSQSNYVLDPNLSIDPEMVYKILSDINKDEKNYNAQLTKQELEIMASDRVIMSKISGLLEKIQTNYQETLNVEKLTAQNTANQSSKLIFGLTFIFFIIGIVLLLVIFHDINVNIRFKNQLMYAKQQAEFSAKTKEQFLANMSHEIRTPLNAILGFTEMLHSSKTQQQHEYIHSIQTASEHLLHIVNDILDVSKIEAGKIHLQSEIFTVEKVVNEVFQLMQLEAKNKHIAFLKQVDDKAGTLIKGDAFRLKQILLNLASNAIKFTSEGKVEINCKTMLRERFADFYFQVADTGIGIPKNKLNDIFNEFSQAEAGTTRKFGGTGLGLTISKKLIEIQKGTIELKSEINKGSVFTFQLTYPIATKKEVEELMGKTNSPIELSSGINVLLIDDEKLNLQLAKIIFDKYNVHVDTYSSAADALNDLEGKEYAIGLIDLHMPVMDGYTFITTLKSQGLKTFPCVALTADAMANKALLISEYNFDDLLLKPYSEQDLIVMIAKWSKENQLDYISSESKPKTINNTTSKIFSLEEIKQFTNNDEVIMCEIIKSFIDEHTMNVTALYNYYRSGDISGVNNIAHKMIPAFSHFTIADAIPILKYLERTKDLSTENTEDLMVQLLDIAKIAFDQLETEYKALNKMMA
ncbi:MAG TPA: ATP-binding protein, partial [Chitinophagales bacterium]|nr:ATP-binding protein [Chitinophagales bacterium]